MVLQMIGKVCSNKMNKSVVVIVSKRRWINKSQGWWTYSRKFMAHDSLDTCNIGDVVKIEQISHRLSKRKAFNVVEILQRENIVTDDPSFKYEAAKFKRPADWSYVPLSAKVVMDEAMQRYMQSRRVTEAAQALTASFFSSGQPRSAAAPGITTESAATPTSG
eukprot:TRINITY_DN3599_c1_g1_i1.p3 TRINITY_DN3599_c1_g1~~TRINITY_DN3599_c1_g1_i1.p3  ORF type:complete len:163 (-),score=10.18 TRINITY_DN3599_c1_g1_i1:280-768(-)